MEQETDTNNEIKNEKMLKYLLWASVPGFLAASAYFHISVGLPLFISAVPALLGILTGAFIYNSERF